MYSIGRSRLRALLLSDSGVSTHARYSIHCNIYHVHATPVPRPYWELQPDVCLCRLPSGNTGRGSVCVGLNVLTHLRVMCTPECTTRPCLSPA